MNEIIITIELSRNDIFFKDCYESDFLNILLKALNSYEVNTEDIYQLRMSQNIQLCHSPHVFRGCLTSGVYKVKYPKKKKSSDIEVITYDEFIERRKGDTDDRKNI